MSDLLLSPFILRRGAASKKLLVLLGVAALLAALAPGAARASDRRGPGDEAAIAALFQKARRAAQASDRDGFRNCLTRGSRYLFDLLLREKAWGAATRFMSQRQDVRPLRFEWEEGWPWGIAFLADTHGPTAYYVKKEEGRWRIERVDIYTVGLILWRNRRPISANPVRSVSHKRIMAWQLPEGWKAADTEKTDEMFTLPTIDSTFYQMLSGPQGRSVSAEIVQFKDDAEAEWRHWRSRREIGTWGEILEGRPIMGDSFVSGRLYQGKASRVAVRKGRRVLLLDEQTNPGAIDTLVAIARSMADRL